MTQLERFRHRVTDEIISAYRDASDSSMNTSYRDRRRGEGLGLEMALRILKQQHCSLCGWGKPKPRRKRASR